MHILLSGYSGSMGQAIRNLILDRPQFSVADLKSDAVLDFSQPNIVIDFSSPENMQVSLDFSIKHKLPFLTGTTGLNNKHQDLLDKAALSIPVMQASNMSIGIANLKHAITHFLETTKDSYDCLVTEIHHTKKIDSPSGTAIDLMKFINNHPQSGTVQSLSSKSYRLGSIFGIHRVQFYNSAGSCYFQHLAQSRAIFAEGALQSSVWLTMQPNLLYSFSDFLDKKL